MKILHAPVNIAGQASEWAAAMREIGHDAQVWSFAKSRYGFPVDRIVDSPRTAAAADALVTEAIAEGFDVVHFHYARTLVARGLGVAAMSDLARWRESGARVVMSFHGSDVRNAERAIAHDEWHYCKFGAIARDPIEIEADLAAIRPHAHAMTFTNIGERIHVPDGVHLPTTINVEALALPEPASRRAPLIVHAPSSRSVKGTNFILESLERLRRRGLRFDLDLIENCSNAEALERIAHADIVMEKTLGYGYGVVGVEAMSLGKALVTRVGQEALDAFPDLPLFTADPPELDDTLGELITNHQLRDSRRSAGRAFALRVHSRAAAAENLTRLYTQKPARTPIAGPAVKLGDYALHLERRLRDTQEDLRRAEAELREERLSMVSRAQRKFRRRFRR